MRCPDCNKFVSMENGDPQVNEVNVEYSDGEFTVSGNGDHSRNCADCSTELKSLSFDCDEETVKLESFNGWNDLNDEQQKRIKSDLAEGVITAEVEETGSDVEESGGGRYKANEISIKVQFRITVPSEPELTYDGELSSTNTAGSYEECC